MLSRSLRTCVGCRRKAPAAEMMRFVFGSSSELKGSLVSRESIQAETERTESSREGIGQEAVGILPRLVPDLLHLLPGRGAYCHPRFECWGASGIVERLRFSLLRAAKGRVSGAAKRSGAGAATGRGGAGGGDVDLFNLLLEQAIILRARSSAVSEACHSNSQRVSKVSHCCRLVDEFLKSMDKSVAEPKSRANNQQMGKRFIKGGVERGSQKKGIRL